MDIWECEGRKFEVVMASDLDRDGMALELTALDDAPGVGPVLEAFWYDSDSRIDFRVHRSTVVPFALIERFIDAARTRLPVAPAD